MTGIKVTTTTGIYLTTKVFPRLGIADEMAKKSKTTGVGPVPADVQYMSMFSAAVVAGSKQLDASKRLIAFLASDRSTGAIQTSGMQHPKRP